MPRLTLRRLILSILAATPLGIAVLTIAVAGGWLTVRDAAALAVAAVVIAALGVAMILLRRVDRRTLAESRARSAQADTLSRHLRDGTAQLGKATQEVSGALADVRGALGEDRMELLIRLDQVTGQLNQLMGSLKQFEHLPTAVTELPNRMRERFTQAADTAATKSSRDLYAKVQAQADLRALIEPRAPMPLFGGFALAADTMHMVASRLGEIRPELIVECGSGSSSVWLGYLVERLGVGQVVSLEHDERYLEASRALVRAHGLEKVVQIRHAPLETWTDRAGADSPWYAPHAFQDLTNIGLLLVDGPPGFTGPQARYPAGPLLLPRCQSSAIVILDDTNRSDEESVSRRWLTEWPNLRQTVHGRSTADVFVLGPSDPGDVELR